MHCEQCRINKENDGIEPSCATCRYQPLLPENLEAISLYENLQRDVVKELDLRDLVFEIWNISGSRDEASMLLEKIDIIHRFRKIDAANNENSAGSRR